MRLHVVSLPHTETTSEYSWCAYTDKVRKFATMMTSLDYEVYLYAGEVNEASCREHIPCIDRQYQEKYFPERIPSFDNTLPGWRAFADIAIGAIKKRQTQGDILCLIGGLAQKPIADALPDMMCVEFGVGYSGIFSNFRVFESVAWQHAVYGGRVADAAQADGFFYDTVIPNYFEAEQFPMGDGGGDYLLYMGRLIERKGLGIVKDIVERTDLPLVVAGDGDTNLIPAGADYVGSVGPAQRAKLMGDARCIITPTLYLEPFGGVAVEAQMCGTPAITTPWGAFTETVEHGVTGYRCSTLAEFCAAAETAYHLERWPIRERALDRYSCDKVRYLYDDYFKKLETLTGAGWYS